MNKAVAFLIRRRLWRFRFIHLVITGLVATVMVSVLLFQGYLMALTGEFTGQLTYPTLPNACLVRIPANGILPSLWRIAPQLQLSTWSVSIAAGQVEMAGVSNTSLSDWPLPAPGEVWLPASQRGRLYTEQVGDILTVSQLGGRDWASAEARVAGYYDDGGYLSPILASMQWIGGWSRQSPNSTIVGYPEQAAQDLRRWASSYPEAELLTPQGIAQGASDLVSSLYSGGYAAVLMGAIFLALGFGVMALLVFLDSRTELAILKALGTRPREAGFFFWGEFSAAVLLGVPLGWWLTQWLQSRLDIPIALSGSVFRTALTVVLISYGLAMLAPARLAQRAQVNDLLFHRPVLLLSQSVSSLSRHEPSLHDLLSRGWSCIRLETDGEAFPGIVLRPVDATVKQGETLAWQSTCFGLGEKKYVAPHDGILRVADESRGVLAIEPIGKSS